MSLLGGCQVACDPKGGWQSGSEDDQSKRPNGCHSQGHPSGSVWRRCCQVQLLPGTKAKAPHSTLCCRQWTLILGLYPPEHSLAASVLASLSVTRSPRRSTLLAEPDAGGVGPGESLWPSHTQSWEEGPSSSPRFTKEDTPSLGILPIRR